MESASLQYTTVNGALRFPSSHHHALHSRSATIPKWGMRRDQDGSMVASRTNGQAFRVLANPKLQSLEYKANTERKKFIKRTQNSSKEIIMVDPLEAKRLAAVQLQQLQAKERLKKRRRIEAINGAWAIIGLTTGLVIEGQTGKSILEQLAGYLSSFVHLFGK